MATPFEFSKSEYAFAYTKVRNRFDQSVRAAGTEESITCGLYGLYGAGKSGFLKAYFSEARCKELAEMGQLYPLIIAIKNPKPEQLFGDICESLAEYVERYVPAEKRPQFPTAEEMQGEEAGKRLREMVKLLRRQGYHVSLVIDEFHRISQCETIAERHYGIFRNLREDAATDMHYIIATDCDVDENNKNHTNNFSTSFFASEFDNFYFTIGGLTREEFDSYIAGFLAKDAPPVFTEKEMSFLYDLTGGFPRIAQKTANALFKIKSAGWQMETELARRAYEEVRGDFNTWCESLTDGQKALLKKMAAEGIESFYEGDEKDAFDRLRERGFVVEDQDEASYDDFGTYRLCCGLFRLHIEKNFDDAYAAVYGAASENIIGEKQRELLQDVRELHSRMTEKRMELEKDSGWSVPRKINACKGFEKELSDMETALAAAPLSEMELREERVRYFDIRREL